MKSLALVVALVALCACLAQTSQGHVILSDMGLYKQSANYTELTFTTPSDLPSALPSPTSPIDASFSVHNVSGTAHTYRWSIALTKGGKSSVKASGAVTVPAQGRATVAKSVKMACVGGRLQVLVRLADPAESINFWVACPAATGKGK